MPKPRLQEVIGLPGQQVASPSTTIDTIMNCDSFPALADSVLSPVAHMLEADSAVYLRFRHDSLGRPFI